MHHPTTPRTVPARFTLRALVACGLILCGCRSADRNDAPETPFAATAESPSAASEGACATDTVERSALVLPDGRHAYVEPVGLLRVGEDLVVVGSPTYTWDVGDARARMASDGAHIAAYLHDTAPRLVEKPLDVEVGTVRSIVLDARRWGLLFSEKPDSAGRIGEASGLWYAEYDGARWSAPESVPMPAEGWLFVPGSSPLASVGGVLHWVVMRNPEGAALHYRRVGDEWRFETIEARGVEAAGLAAGPSGMWLALTGLDAGAPATTKTARLFHWEERWRLVSRDRTAEPYTEIRWPSVMASSAGVTVTWMEMEGAGVVMARVGVGVEDPGRLVVVEEAAPVVRPYTTASGTPAWLVQHVNPVIQSSELRFVRPEGREVRIARAIPNPYTGLYAAVAVESGAVVVTGAEFSPDPARPTVRSLTLRLNPSCR